LSTFHHGDRLADRRPTFGTEVIVALEAKSFGSQTIDVWGGNEFVSPNADDAGALNVCVKEERR